MHLRALLWYISGMMALWFTMTLFITYHPRAELFVFCMQAISAGGALVFAVAAAWVGRLPTNHWLHRSRKTWITGIAVAVTVTLLVVSLG